jgi:hypothetical protein
VQKYCTILKFFNSRTRKPISMKLDIKLPWVKGIYECLNLELGLLKKEITTKIQK